MLRYDDCIALLCRIYSNDDGGGGHGDDPPSRPTRLASLLLSSRMTTPSTWPNPRSLPAAATVPPMSRLHRKLVARSTRAGLIVRPFDSNAHGSYRGAAVLIKWKTNTPVQLGDWQETKEDDEESMMLHVDGIAGLLEGFSGA